ncbi:MAG: asparagine synthase (glutamine-hydrolyzing) [Acidobacteria bacterium]|nr:asparagine synthase (glutamine-hydrolyzing) [Acidobacteriota bacterium]
MCGISGIYSYNSGQPIREEILRAMTGVLAHRGPDDAGYFIDNKSPNPIGLGHRRLSVIDLQSGHQPMLNEDGSLAIVFNGEIYNYRELNDFLSSRGHDFKTRSDTETILHLYEEFGESCVDKLRGMFAFAIRDDRKNKVILARDRVGKKPLYYADTKGSLIFGSELKAVIEHPSVERELDCEALADYFTCQYIPSPKTIFRGVRKLPAGHILVASPEGILIRKYWDLDFGQTDERTESEWCDLLIEEFQKAVELRMISDVPLGAFLSGGLDSSAVVSQMTGLADRPVTTTTVGFSLEQYSETSEARELAGLLGTDHHESMITPDSAGVIEKLAWHFDEPFADSSAIPAFYVSQAARQFVKVALSGDGGDENFAGYRRYLFDAAENRVRAFLPEFIREPLFGVMAAIYPKADWLPQPLRAKSTLMNLSLDPASAYFNSVYGAVAQHRERILGKEFLASLNGYDPFDQFLRHYKSSGSGDPLSCAMYADIKTYLADDILTKVDRASMAVSLEVRSPLLDHKFMALAARIPSRLKLKGLQGKYIFRKAAESLLPRQVLDRPKRGFVIPISEWLRTDLKPMAREILFNFNGGADDGLVDGKYVDELWRGHQSGLSDFSRPLWTALIFRLWQRKFMHR